MFLKRFFWTNLDNPKNPLLGPTLKGLQIMGLLRTNSRKTNLFYNFILIFSCFCVTSELINLFFVRNEVSSIAENLFLSSTSIICMCKWMTFLYWHQDWNTLTKGVAYEELLHKDRVNRSIRLITANYTAYARNVSFAYAVLLVFTLAYMLVTPFFGIIISEELRIKILNGTEPFPLIVDDMWYPFDHTKSMGYVLALLIQLFKVTYFCFHSIMFDSHAISLMVFFKGQLLILKDKSKNIFEDQNYELTIEIVKGRIMECHRHHNHLLALKSLYKSLMSPVMFVYVLLCSTTICCCVIQLSLVSSTSEKLFYIEFIVVVVLQLFLYCWHSSLVTFQSKEVASGVFESSWWRADVRTRRDLVLLAGKMSQPFRFDAGPFTSLSLTTFIDILKASYSYYTFLNQVKK